MKTPSFSAREVFARCPTALWPTLPLELVPELSRSQFTMRCDAMRYYEEGMSQAKIAQLTGVARRDLPRLLKRCIVDTDEGKILGFRALVPGAQVVPYTRAEPVAHKRAEQRGGMAGALGALLKRFPDIRSELVKLILKAKKNRPSEERIRPAALHRIFLDCIQALGVSKSEWPFTTQYLGGRSISQFMSEVVQSNFDRYVHATGEQPARAHLYTGTGTASLIKLEQPYAAFELDAFNIPALLTVQFETPEGTFTEKVIDRLWLVAAIDREGGALLGWTVVYATEISADDVLRVLRMATHPKPSVPELTIPNLRYPDSPWLPAHAFPECAGALPGVLFLDGALQHLAQAVRDGARQQLGFAINYGPVAHFERRPGIERFFANLATRIFHRYPSTTGSHPHSGRNRQAEANAVRHSLRASHAEQLLACEIAQYNLRPSEGLYYISPIQHLHFHLHEDDGHFLPRKLPHFTAGEAVLPTRTTRKVCGSVKSGRRPYVTIDRVRYTNPILADSGGLIGQQLLIEIDEDDYRKCHAFTQTGGDLGFLIVHGKWGNTKHSRRTRCAINRLVNKRILSITQENDPVQCYMAYLGAQIDQSPARAKHVDHNATPLARVARDAQQTPKIVARPAPAPPPMQPRSLGTLVTDNLLGTAGPDLRTLLSRKR